MTILFRGLLACLFILMPPRLARGQQPGKPVRHDEAEAVQGIAKISSPMDADFWDKMAESYEQKAHPLSVGFSRKLFNSLPVHAGTTVLDIATGTGAAAIVAAEHGADVTAIDFSQEMLTRLESRRIPKIRTLKMDGHALTFPDRSFDVSVSVFGIMLFRDWEQGLREMVRVTKPEGKCALIVWDGPQGVGLNRIVADCCKELGIELPPVTISAGMEHLADPDRLRQALVVVGLTDVSVLKLKEKTAFRLSDVFAANPIANHLSPGQQESILLLLQQKHRGLTKPSKDNDVTLRIESSALLGVGVRR